MRIDIYQSVKNPSRYFSVRAGEHPISRNDTDPDFATLTLHRKNLEIKAGDGRGGLNSADIISQIETKGFATHAVSIKITEAEQ